MPTAINPNTRPTRGAALRFGGAALIAGLATAANAGTPNPDEALAELARRLLSEWDATEIIAREGKSLPPFITPQSEDQEQRLADAFDVWRDTVDEIVDIPARSMAGLVAKAAAMQNVLDRLVLTHRNEPKAQQLLDAKPGERLAWSLAADLLAVGGAA